MKRESYPAPKLARRPMEQPAPNKFGAPEPTYHVQNQITGKWAVIDAGELEWTQMRSDATAVSERCADDICEEVPCCLVAYAGHRVLEDER